MAKRFTYYGSKKSILTPAEIFGANYYDHWDYTDAATVSLTGSLIDGVASKGLNGAFLGSTGTARPSLVSADINGYDVASFNGSSNFMQVSASTAMYNFLHFGGGYILVIYKPSSLGVTASIIGNSLGGVGIGFRLLTIATNSFSHFISNGAGGAAGIVALNDAVGVVANNYALSAAIAMPTAVAADRSEILYNNVSYKNNTDTNAAINSNSLDNLFVGKRASVNDQWFGGNIPEILIANAIPTPTQLTQLNAFYTNKYGTFPV